MDGMKREGAVAAESLPYPEKSIQIEPAVIQTTTINDHIVSSYIHLSTLAW